MGVIRFRKDAEGSRVILIQRGKEPDSLLKYRKSTPGACYEELPAKPREDIRSQMWEEQRGLCAYCMRKLDSYQAVRIEHYLARNPEDGEYDAASTLDYKHMLGVCYGNSLQPDVREEDRTCDAHRGRTKLTVNPYELSSIRKIHYTRDGYITSDDEDIKRDVDETLNLNCIALSLPESRKGALERTQRELREMCKNKGHDAYVRALRSRYKRYVVDRAYTPYCGIVIEWLEKELGIN